MTSPRKGHQTKNVSQPGWREGGAARPRSALLSLNGSTSGGRAGGSCSPASRGPPSPNPGCLFPSRPQSRSGPPRCRRGREGCGGGGRRCCRCCCWRCGAGSRGGRERSARQRTQVGRGARAVHLPSAPPPLRCNGSVLAFQRTGRIAFPLRLSFLRDFLHRRRERMEESLSIS